MHQNDYSRPLTEEESAHLHKRLDSIEKFSRDTLLHNSSQMDALREQISKLSDVIGIHASFVSSLDMDLLNSLMAEHKETQAFYKTSRKYGKAITWTAGIFGGFVIIFNSISDVIIKFWPWK